MRKECQQYKVRIWSGLQNNVGKKSFHTYSSINFLANTYFVMFRITDEWKIQNTHIPDRKS